MPVRRLPARPDLAHLKHQAADLLDGQRMRVPQVLQRLREFHPRMRAMTDAQISAAQLKLSDAYLAIAREYGFPSWSKLKDFVEHDSSDTLDRPAQERIADPDVRRAVGLLDKGRANELREHLGCHPGLVQRRVTLYGGNYFQTPTLLEFVAENPTRRGTLPKNIVEIALIILDAGARKNRDALDSTLELVASSRVARESGAQRALIGLLCEYGADPNVGMLPALMYGEFDGAAALLNCGATMNVIAASGLGQGDVQRFAVQASENELRIALALAAQHGRTEAVKALLQAGADAVGFTPPPAHSHATPLHQAALWGHGEIADLLLAHGARLDLRDIFYGGTPADWAKHNGFRDLAARLRD